MPSSLPKPDPNPDPISNLAKEAADLGVALNATFVPIGEGLYAATTTMTPIASKWALGNLSLNRDLTKNRIDMLERAMGKGWQLNGSALVFDHFGRLIAGHHRAAASVRSDTPFKTVVIFGVAPEAFYTFDMTQELRLDQAYRAGQAAGKFDEADAPELTVRTVRALSGLVSKRNPFAFAKIEMYEVDNLIRTYPGIMASVELVKSALGQLSSKFQLHLVALFHYQLSHGKNALRATVFVRELLFGTPPSGSPGNATTLRDRVNRMHRISPHNFYLALVIYWNATLSGKALSSFSPLKRSRIPGIRGTK